MHIFMHPIHLHKFFVMLTRELFTLRLLLSTDTGSVGRLYSVEWTIWLD